MEIAATVYLATNKLNGHRYVGITRFTIAQRWAQHIEKSRFPKCYFHRAINKYGSENFEVVGLASCFSRETSGEIERQIIQSLQPEYNLTNGGEATRGRMMTPEVRQKQSISHIGVKHSEAVKLQISETKKRQYREKPSFKKAALEALARGRANPKVQEKRAAAAAKSAKERIWTEESRAKLSASCMGRKLDKDAIFRMRMSKFKPVYCYESDSVYGCIDEVTVRFDFSYDKIKAVCDGKLDSYKGLTFFYVNDIKGKIADFPLERTE